MGRVVLIVIDGLRPDAVEALEEKRYHVFIQSDHGGAGYRHEESNSEVLTVPWIAAGPMIRKGLAIEGPMSILDTAPTIAALLGIPCHPSWQGRARMEIFTDSTAKKSDNEHKAGFE